MRYFASNSGPIWFVLIVVSVIAFPAGCGKPLASLSSLAEAGRIDSVAPVQAKVKISIGASSATVWELLVHAQQWPDWNPQIRQVHATGQLRKGMVFGWETGDTSITSKVQLAETDHRLAWTGTALSAKAIHVWELDEGPGGQTLVRVQESLEGPLINHFMSSTELANTDMQWLVALKTAAEHR